jgi:hypothetical protein
MELNDLLNNLIGEEDIPVDFDNLAPQRGGAVEPPQPGPYAWTLPKVPNFEQKEFQGLGPRIQAVFREDKSLTGVGPTGESFLMGYTITNAEIFEDETTKTKASEMNYLLEAVGHVPKGKKNSDYAKALTAACAEGKQFVADVEWYVKCDKKKDIYKEGKVVPGVKGCGAEYAQESYKKRKDQTVVGEIPRVNGTNKFSYRFECTCGAELRVFPSLRRYRPRKG